MHIKCILIRILRFAEGNEEGEYVMEIFITFLICILATTIGAINGIGGGVIIKPILDATSSMGVEQISFLSGITALAMAIVSLFKSRKMSKKFNPNILVALALGSALGGVIGKIIFNYIKEATGNINIIGLIQNSLMLFLMIFVMIYMINKSKIKTFYLTNKILCMIIGLGLGICSSFLGIGGGPINLVVLYFFFSLDAKNATYNSIFIILLSQMASIIFSFVSKSIPDLNIPMLIFMVMGGILGGLFGKTISNRMNNENIEKLFFIVLIGISIITVWNIYKFGLFFSY